MIWFTIAIVLLCVLDIFFSFFSFMPCLMLAAMAHDAPHNAGRPGTYFVSLVAMSIPLFSMLAPVVSLVLLFKSMDAWSLVAAVSPLLYVILCFGLIWLTLFLMNGSPG